MQYRIPAAPAEADVSTIESALTAADPAAVVDYDAHAGAVRVSTQLPGADVLALVRGAGLTIDAADIIRIPSECCGGCGG
ncbi:MAG TPA: hypothetical protein VIG68_03555 [Lysobacter sp.]